MFIKFSNKAHLIVGYSWISLEVEFYLSNLDSSVAEEATEFS